MDAAQDPMIEDILQFWFGRVEETLVPSKQRARVWFGESEEIDAEIKSRYSSLLTNKINELCGEWQKSARGQLALIILLDQFSRHIYHGVPEAYVNDATALTICEQGINAGTDHALSLIERVFYYFPLLHSEDIVYQERAIAVYQQLVALSLPETRAIYDRFLRFANHHFEVISEFGRFPQRNAALGRKTTDSELIYLRENDLGDV